MADEREQGHPGHLGDRPGSEARTQLERLAAQLVSAPSARIVVPGEGPPSLALPGRALPEAALPFPIPWGEGGPGPAQPLVVADARRDPALCATPAVSAGQVAAYAAVPLLTATRTILGHLCVVDTVPRAWTADELARLTDLAGLAGAALRAEGALRRQVQVQALHEAVSRALTRQESLEAALPLCADALARYLDVALAAIWTGNPAGPRWALAAHAGRDGFGDATDLLDPAALAAGFHSAAFAQTRQPYLTNALTDAPHLVAPAWAAAHRLVASAGYPLTVGDDVLGAIGIFAHQPLPPDTLPALGLVASLLAQMITRTQAAAALYAWNDALEARVLERTVQMEAVITTLRQEIANREQVESALRASEERYRTLVEMAPDIIYNISARDGTVVSVNPAFEQLTGWTMADWLGRPFSELVHPDDLPLTVHIFSQIVSGAAPVPYQLRILCKAGDYRVGEFISVPRVENGTVVGLFGIGRDVTDRQHVLEALRESEERFRRLAENAPDLIYRYDLKPQPHHTYISPAVRRVLGYSPAEFYADPHLLLKIVHAEDHAAMAAVLLGQDTTTRETLRFTHQAGHQVWLDLRRVPIHDEAGQVIAFEGIARDVSEQKRAEQALRDSEQRYRTLFVAAQRQARELALLDQVRTALTHDLDLPALLRTVVEAIAQTFGYTQVGLYLLDGQTLRLQHAVGDVHNIPSIPISAGVVGQVVRTGRPVLLEDVRTEPRFLPAGADINSEVCVPLFDQDRVVGVLNVESTAGLKLTRADLRLITVLGEHINLALGRARLYSAVRQSEERFHTLSDLTLEGVAIHDQGRIVEANLSLARMFGYELEELIGQSVLGLTAPESRTLMRTHYLQPGEAQYEALGLRKDGTTFPGEVHSRQVPYQGRLLRVASIRDITERKQAEEALRRQNEELAALHDTTLGLINQLDPTQLLEAIIARAAALIGTPHGYLYVVEPEQQTLVTRLGIGIFAQQIGYQLKWGEGLSGRVWARGEPLAVEDYNQWPGHLPDREPLGLYAIVGIPLRSGGEVVGVIGLAFDEPGRRIGPDEIALLTRFGQLASLALENARLYAAAQQELSDRKRAEETMAHLALHDSLTNLPNRALLHERLRQAILAARRNDQTLALLIMDMDRFKEVNDTLGHYYGDVLLCQVGERLRDGLRASDTVARLGGDEFAVLLPGADLTGAHWAADKLLSILERPFELEGQLLDVRISIGIALYPDHGADAETLLRRADVAMYVAKRGGTGYAMYTTDQDPYNPTRLSLIGDLRRAIEQETLVLHYQPKLNYRTGQITGVEALVRWPHPVHGLLPPDQFIPLAEQMGLIKPLSRCVLNQALRQCRAWHDAGLVLPVAVNLSLRDLHDARLPEQIGQLLETWALPPALLHVEITEDAAMADPARTLGILTWLRGLGVHLAIDDFGTGQSSLAQLKRLPVDQLKIDKSFVGEMTVNDNDAVIVRSIIDLGHNLGLTVVAEGVEDFATADLLTALGCDEGQGFYLSRAVPAEALVQWLAERVPAPLRAGDPPRLAVS